MGSQNLYEVETVFTKVGGFIEMSSKSSSCNEQPECEVENVAMLHRYISAQVNMMPTSLVRPCTNALTCF